MEAMGGGEKFEKRITHNLWITGGKGEMVV